MNKEIQINGRKIFYRIIGKGKPVVLVHGFGEDGEVWKTQVDFLKDQFQLIVPDLPGSGKSDDRNWMTDGSNDSRPSSAIHHPPFRMDDYADILKSLLDFESVSRCTMIGHSMAGYITLAFAEKYPGYLNAFGLFHSTAYPDSEEKKATRKKGIEFIREYGAFEFLKTTTPNLFSPKTRDERQELVDEQIAGLSNFSAPVLVKYYESMMQRPDRTAVLKEAKVPVLFIMGKYDNAAPLDDVLQQCYLPEKSYIHILHESGHMGMLEEPEKTNRVLKEFLLAT